MFQKGKNKAIAFFIFIVTRDGFEPPCLWGRSLQLRAIDHSATESKTLLRITRGVASSSVPGIGIEPICSVLQTDALTTIAFQA